tara:strand:+ start:7547 stop:8113 length:567 start_codon:yes stop_codon:yes gene_type:complete
MDNTFGGIEKRLHDEGFEVKHLHRDTRHDWGDDSGYIVSISEKNDKIYLHVLQVNYNIGVDSHILDESDKRFENGCTIEDHADFIICDSMEDAQNKVNEFVAILDKCVEEELRDWGLIEEVLESDGGYDDFPSEALLDELRKLPESYHNFIDISLFAYSEYEQDKEALLNLTNSEYKQNFTDEDPREY